ncbi:uncharacterized protein LOC124913692 [Impatiens glandulifera]|uniref:uncharacterized protein LOC124913692 n=1 Tax=Impatiens glandulifera TaxID=253017 RepID=UPI001FB15792|nr:uncharacterized protein LOC124913692 [Impatiens glandulifera]
MSEYLNKQTRNSEKPFPGCLRRMVNLFDLSTAAGNRLLTDKAHRDGHQISRSQLGAAVRTSPLEDQMIMTDPRRNPSCRKLNATPVKMLIAEEMSKEAETMIKSPCLVAKLMGLDALPQSQLDSSAQITHSRGHSRSYSANSLGSWQQDNGYFPEHVKYKDAGDTWKPFQKSFRRDKSPEKDKHNEGVDERKMALVRQKFQEAKSLATDERLRQTKQFQDALDVLSSNKDLLLKFLQEPSSPFSQHLYDRQSVHPSTETKRITVLRPAKMVESNISDGFGKKNEAVVSRWDKATELAPPVTWKEDNYQPTRIVVLKPSHVMAHDIKADVSSLCSSPRVLQNNKEFYDEPAEEITKKMRGNQSGNRRDETLLTSAFSNGYIADESSFTKSESGYSMGNLSDSEVISPTSSRHSWDYINKYSNPYSSSSFSRASYSPESSVCKEAKKRLSERWAMMASNGNFQDQKHVRRSSSTLGEMLALSGSRRSEKYLTESSGKGSTSKLDDDNSDGSPRKLLRSRSVPVSSNDFGTRLIVDAQEQVSDKVDAPKERKSNNVKSTFRGKVSSLFFSRTKKSHKETCIASQTTEKSTESDEIHSPVSSLCTMSTRIQDGSSPNLVFAGLGPKSGVTSEVDPFATKSGNTGENHSQPSPISVLEPPFEDDDSGTAESSCNVKFQSLGEHRPVHANRSNLVDKSPPIGSIARTLSWDDSRGETVSTNQPTREEEEGEWLLFVKTLLSQSETCFPKWHSPESPLDPSLRDNYIDTNDKMVFEARRRQKRSGRKLVFDYVNATLSEMTGYGPETSLWAAVLYGGGRPMNKSTCQLVQDEVWDRMKEQEWFSSKRTEDSGDRSSMVVDKAVTKEIAGKGWSEQMGLEIDNIGREIEANLLDELVRESVIEFTNDKNIAIESSSL